MQGDGSGGGGCDRTNGGIGGDDRGGLRDHDVDDRGGTQLSTDLLAGAFSVVAM